MSLVSSGAMGGGFGAGGAAGGLTMAHQANSVGVPPSVPQQQYTNANASSSGVPPPSTSAAALGADLIDKNQTGLSMKQVRNRQHLPIVAIDLHAADGKATVAYFPKKSDDPSKGEPPVYVTTVDTDVKFQSDKEVAHKTLKKFLSGGKNFLSLQNDSLVLSSASTPKDKKTTNGGTAQSTIVFEKPHQWMGLRRLSDAPKFILSRAGIQNSDDNGTSTISDNTNSLSHAISEEVSTGVGVFLENATIDGVSAPLNDDYDRVVAKVRLHSSKKAISVLPEDAVKIILNSSQYAVADKLRSSAEAATATPTKSPKKSNSKVKSIELDDDEIVEYPIAVALPAWAIHDSYVEAVMEATEGTGVVVPRSVAAATGALLPSLDGAVTPVLQRISVVRNALQKDHQRELVENPDAPFDDSMIFLLFGMTDCGFESTAIQISNASMNNISCVFSNFRVIANVSYQSDDPLSLMQKCSQGLEDAIETISSESDGPCGIIFYGSSTEQEQMKTKWNTIKVNQEEWKAVPTFVTEADTVARGIAVMGGIAHGRLTKQTTTVNSAGKKKVKSHLGIKVQNVALTAVGVSFNYHGDEKGTSGTKWTPVKTIFDFDRQTPAGPHSFDLNAAQCSVYKEMGADAAENLSYELFLKEVAKYEGSKGIPAREDAALNLRLQVYEKWTRDGDWKKVGDPIEPLVMRKSEKNSTDAKENTETRVACEEIVFELSLAVTGLLTTSLVGERTSVVVATKAARNSKIRYYVGILFLILFCGGFLFKSWYDDYVLERDAKRLLAFYHHMLPGSIQDGDVHNARYTCYKFRNKKSKLWAKLEKKYGEPVLDTYQYLAMKDSGVKSKNQSSDDDGETLDLDDDEEETASNDKEL